MSKIRLGSFPQLRGNYVTNPTDFKMELDEYRLLLSIPSHPSHCLNPNQQLGCI